MAKILQEKFQISMPPAKPEDTSWVTDQEGRAKKQMPGREGRPGGDRASRYMNNARFFNSLPPGEDIEDQEVCDIRKMEVWTGPYNQATQEINPESLRKGFNRKKLLSTDDEYTRQHNDSFYDSVEVDGDEGFIERNNMLDRL